MTRSQPSFEHSCNGPSPNFRPLIPATCKQDIQPSAQSVEGECEQPRDFRLALGELEREFPDGAERSELIQRRAADLGRSPGHDDASPFLEEPPCRGQADAAGPPNDQASAAVEPAGTWHVRTPDRQRCSPSGRLNP